MQETSIDGSDNLDYDGLVRRSDELLAQIAFLRAQPADDPANIEKLARVFAESDQVAGALERYFEQHGSESAATNAQVR